MRRLWVVTHPEATHHVERRIGGWFDSDLTPRGREHADRIASRLRELVPAGAPVELFSSDLARTAQTAATIGAGFGVAPTYLSGLREKSYGVAEGRNQDWLDARFVPPPEIGDRMSHFEGIQGAETRGQLGARIYRAIESIVTRPAQEQIVVTHGFALTMVVCAWIRMPLDAAGSVSFRSHSGGITELVEDDYVHNRTVVRLNDTDHLR
jgi:probable phosphoglycerate mutase